jgi:phage-related minor tail protein
VSDTSLVFNLVAREEVSETLGKVKEKFSEAATGIAAGVAGALGAGVAADMDMSAANAKLAAQLGIGPAEAAKLAKVSADVYANDWGDSTEQVNEAIKGVYQNIGDTSKAKGGLEGVTTKALALAQTFDQEVGPTTAAVGQMLKTGLAKNADEAFDILTRGFQTGANKADDLLDTVNEYGVQWKKFGLDGQTAMGLLSQGLKGGARDADLVADSIKEFSIRAIDGSTTTAAGFKAIGLNAQTMAAQIGKGGKGATDALDETLDRLRNIKDPVKRSAAAVQLFGTQAEDLGDALYSLDPSTAVSALGKVGGAADRMSKTVSNSPAAALETFKRQATVKLAEVGGVFVSFAMDNKGAFEPLAAILGTVAAAILAVSVAQKIYATYTAIASAAQTIWNAEIWASTAALLANPMTWIVLAIIALIAVIVIIATKTTWFQTIWSTVWGAIKTAFSATVSWLSGAFAWFGTLPGKFAHWFGEAKNWAIRKLVELVMWQVMLPKKIWDALSGLGSMLASLASNAYQRMRNAAVLKAAALIDWMRGLPGKARAALGALGSYLYNSGRSLLLGFVHGITSMLGPVKGAVTKVLSGARNLLPFSPAREGPFSGSGWTLYSGRSVIAAFAQGIQDRAALARNAMADAVGGAATGGQKAISTATSAPTPSQPLTTARMGRPDVRLVFEGGHEPFMDWFKERIRIEYGGDVTNLNGGR